MLPNAIRFRCAALDYRPLREPSDDCAILIPSEGSGSQLAIKLVSPDAKSHQRHHLDLYAADQTAEVERLLHLGAQTVEWTYPAGADYIVLADPAPRLVEVDPPDSRLRCNWKVGGVDIPVIIQ